MGQVWLEIFTYFGMGKEDAAAWTTLTLILESVLLTGFGLYPKIAKVGGAGCLVPITGFANGVVSPAIEFQAERPDFWCRSEDIYNCRSRNTIRNIFKLDSRHYIYAVTDNGSG